MTDEQQRALRDVVIAVLIALTVMATSKMLLQEEWGEIITTLLAIAYFIINWLPDPEPEEEEDSE